MNNRIPSLDFLRAMAILSVLLLHSSEFLSGIPVYFSVLFSYGWAGVDLFFVLSGFLIGSQAFQEKECSTKAFKKFLLKRWFRTFPLYYTVLVIYLLIKPLLGYPFIGDPLKFIFFIQNFYSPKDFVQSWSLCIEEQFYLLFPIIFYGALRIKKISSFYWLIPGFLSTFYRLYLYRIGIPATNPPEAAYHFHFQFFTHLDGISWGIFLASTFNSWSKFKNKHYFLSLGVIILIGSLIYIEPANLNAKVILSFQLLAIAFSLILIGIYDIKNIPFKNTFQTIALWSYGLYLWNNLVVKIVLRAPSLFGNFGKLLLFFFISFLLSAVSYYSIEKPFLKWRDILLKKVS